MAACLAESGVASHRAAASLFDLDGFPPCVVEVTVRRWKRRVNCSLRVHESTGLADTHRSERRGIPVTTIERALLAIECDSDKWRSGRQRRQADFERQNRLILAGWTLLRFTWDHLADEPHLVLAQVASALHSPAPTPLQSHRRGQRPPPGRTR